MPQIPSLHSAHAQSRVGRLAGSGMWPRPVFARQRSREVATSAFRTVHVIRPVDTEGGALGASSRPEAASASQLREAFAALSPRPEVLLVAPHPRCLRAAAAAVAGRDPDEGPLTVEAEPLLRSRGAAGVVASPAVAAQFPGVVFPASVAQDGWWRRDQEEEEDGGGGADGGAGSPAAARQPEPAVAVAASSAAVAATAAATTVAAAAVSEAGLAAAEAEAEAEAQAGETAAAFRHRLVRLRVSAADRPARVLALVAEDERVVAALTRGGGASAGSSDQPDGATEEQPLLQPGQLTATVRMELFCSRCRCGACWAPAKW